MSTNLLSVFGFNIFLSLYFQFPRLDQLLLDFTPPSRKQGWGSWFLPDQSTHWAYHDYPNEPTTTSQSQPPSQPLLVPSSRQPPLKIPQIPQKLNTKIVK